ncbi:MAG: hypothetical protein ACR2GO_01645 [Candidatus Limnocylindria bacterium]
MTTRRRPVILALSVFLSAAIPAAPAAFAAPPISPLVGEVALTDAERQHALDTMRPNERAELHRLFGRAEADVLVLSYDRRLVSIVTTPDGKQRPEEVVKAREVPGSSLRVPNESIAGYATKDDLYVSLTVTGTRSTRPYEWRVWTYAEWRDGLMGMNPVNSSADSMALAWAGGASLHSQTARGSRYSQWPCADEELDEWPSDGTANVGTAWSFHEFGRWGCPMHWALADIRIRQDRLVGRTDNLVYRYYHTYGGLDYGLSFSRSPGISISPTKEQWSLALFGSYTH